MTLTSIRLPRIIRGDVKENRNSAAIDQGHMRPQSAHSKTAKYHPAGLREANHRRRGITGLETNMRRVQSLTQCVRMSVWCFWMEVKGHTQFAGPFCSYLSVTKQMRRGSVHHMIA
ncbi:hypothetical protein AB6A40_011379 [Gnathostoma spinigerum]|uniref:Uncharacterized protein n=1 Tax=Gnathostoma spinigerum TaxID=75299 RepID=A0ABD6EYY7_9BILA